MNGRNNCAYSLQKLLDSVTEPKYTNLQSILTLILHLQLETLRRIGRLLQQKLQITRVKLHKRLGLGTMHSQPNSSFANLKIITHEVSIVCFLNFIGLCCRQQCYIKWQIGIFNKRREINIRVDSSRKITIYKLSS